MSERALSIWAKSVYRDPRDERYLQLWQHLEDTGEIASYVWDEFVADDVADLIAQDIGDKDSAGMLYRFVAAIHDVGKASPAFVAQVPRFADAVRATGLRIDPSVAGDELRSRYRHELVGSWTVESWLERQGLRIGDGTLAHGMAGIVAGHHGTSLNAEKQELRRRYRYGTFAGNEDWETVRFELLDWIAERTGVLPVLHGMRERPLRRRTQILLTALVIIADWIASDSRLCSLNESPADEHRFDPRRRAARAWRMLALPEPWRASMPTMSADELFSRQFDIPHAKLRPVQQEAVRMSKNMTEPGLMIIEANMGEGKTEAALLSAEIIAAKFHCGGIYYALPTQATVNAMFTRVLDWIGHLPAEDRRMMTSLFLAHGKRELNDEYETLRERWFDDGHGLDDAFRDLPSVGSVDDDPDPARTGSRADRSRNEAALQAVVNSWLTGRKRGLLSNFVVGTIDQVLMAGLRCKHVVLRHLALAGKVVILDEIHSNTAYMNVYMETVLAWLGTYGVPVIMLSATLPQDRRRAFLEAYRQGANAAACAEPMPKPASMTPGPQPLRMEHDGEEALSHVLSRIPMRRRIASRSNEPSPDDGGQRSSATTADNPSNPSNTCVDRHSDDHAHRQLDLRYPLISTSTANGIADISPASSGRATEITVSMISDDDESLVRLLRDRLKEGGCAVVIRNTVSRAQRTYDLLKRRLSTDVTLSHSRFLAFDRARADRELIRRYGKHSSADNHGQRNGVVVATQVVEQSLDVDFDLMITDIAPIDLILQRAGRLHRHHRGDGECERPRPLRSAQLVITGIDEYSPTKPSTFAKGLEHVYQRYLLMRSLAVLRVTPASPATVTIPDDIPRLVQTVYADGDICPKEWRTGTDGEQAARAAMRSVIDNSENEAGQLRILNPQYAKDPFSLDGWLYTCVPDPDTPGTSRQQLVSAGVRESDDSFEVVVLQQDADGNLQLPAWGAFASAEPLPAGIGAPDRRQTRDILSCTISLGQSSLAGNDIDSVIETLEASVPEQWRTYMVQNRDLAGQLLVVLDDKGHAQYTIHDSKAKGGRMRTLRFQYSTERGWATDAK
nr:CRISPR-associated helicase Cas3' [Bifidobacterium amazonense]